MNSFILVPTDFTEAADNAFRHAIYTAKNSGAKIYLLHLCKSTNGIETAKIKLEEQLKKEAQTSVVIENIIRVGDFINIPTIAKELGAQIIFMGTHGTNGIQKIMGSNALKLVTKSEIPFIIVQKDSPAPTGYRKIIVPTSFHFENKQKIMSVSEIAKYFNSKICFIYNVVDPRIMAKSLQNLNGMKSYLDKKGIKYEVEKSENKNFNKDTLNVAYNVNAELIAIMNMQKEDVIGTGLFGKNYEQELIMNDQKIPVMIMSPKFTRLTGSVLAQ
jgi:nucleotide-binding universal stress UspA family protein